MKTIKIFLFAATLVATTSVVNAQLLKANLPASEKSLETIAANSEANKFSSARLLGSKAGYKAVRNFNAKFKDGENVKWTNESKVICASFSDAGSLNTVVYDKKGNWIRDMKSYMPDQMPEDVRETLQRSKYADCKITYIQEFTEDGVHFFVVHLEDAKTCKQVTVYEGEVSLLSQFKKQ